MAQVRAFRGIRYNLAQKMYLGLVTCPPYDVISPAGQKTLYIRHSLNAVRLEQGLEQPTDTAKDNKYTRAERTYRKWREEEVLQPENKPAFYVYDQAFTYAGRSYRRRSLLGAVRLEPWDRGVVLPHEQTMPKPKSDRLSLMRACRAAFSPLLALYEDGAGIVAQTLERCVKIEPEACFTDDTGEEHSLWVVDDPTNIATVARALASSPIYMADGHHRYETALAYRDERRALEPAAGPDAAFEYVMMALESINDPGMVILPTHRVVAGPPRMSWVELVAQLERWFAIEKLEDRSPIAVRQALSSAADTGASVFVMAIAGETSLYRLELREPAALRALMPPGRCSTWQELDVTVLQTAIIEGTLHLSQGDPALTFTRNENEALQAVRYGDAWLAICLRPTRLEQIRQVSLAGDRMPEKSTYFYPKLLSGLVMYDLG